MLTEIRPIQWRGRVGILLPKYPSFGTPPSSENKDSLGLADAVSCLCSKQGLMIIKTAHWSLKDQRAAVGEVRTSCSSGFFR